MACVDENTFAAYFDLKLSADETLSLFEHLDGCAVCFRLFNDCADLLTSHGPDLGTAVTVDDRGERHGTGALQLTLGRYRIDRVLGFGGMGVVYAAHDPQLDRHVALKLLRPDRRSSVDELHARLVREAQAMARLSHPNVITVFEAGTFEQRVFIAMELVDGVTLRQWLRESPRAWRDVLRAFLVAGAGLQAAHEAGLVHRDFKPDNVLVARSGRICVTDFGLARLVRDAAAPVAAEAGRAVVTPGSALEVSMTVTGAFAGTPQYMAPEQLAGGGVDRRTDVFSFCVSLYEALYGERPFAGETLPELARNVVAGKLQPPRATRVPARVRRTLLAGLSVDPAARPQTMQRLLDALARAARPRGPRLAVVAGVAALALGAGFVATRPRTPLVSGPQSQRAAALLPLANRSAAPDAGWLSPAIGQIVTAQIQAAGGPRLQPATDVARMERELGLLPAQELSREQLRHVRDDLRVDYVLSGSYRAGPGDALALTVRMVDAASGRTLAVADERGTQQGLAELAGRAGTQLRAGLGMAALAGHERDAASAALPSLLPAARAFGQGLYCNYLNEAIGARQAFAEAVRLEPGHAHSHLQLARSLKTLGFDREARAEAKRALELSTHLEREDQLIFEAYYREVNNEWDRAIELNRALVTFFPDRPLYALRLAAVQSRARRGPDCLATVAAFRKLPLPDPENPETDMAEAWCADAASDYRLSQTLTARAAAEADRRGAKLLAARARYLEGRALHRLGRLDEALARQEAARATFHALGDRAGDAGALLAEGLIYYDRNQQDKERPLLTQAIAIYREVGYRNGEVSALNSLAICSSPAQARGLFEQAAAIAREINDDVMLGAVIGNVALLDANAGDMQAARRGLLESIAVEHRAGEINQEAFTLSNLCPIELRRGDAAAALAACGRAAELWQKTGEAGVPRVMLSRDQALALAALRRLPEAETLLQAATERARALKAIGAEASIELARAEVLRRRGRSAEALRAVERARALERQQPDPELRVVLAAAAGRVAAAAPASATRAAARAALTGAIADARAHGWIMDLREARLAAAELDWVTDRKSRAELTALADEARAAGDLFIAGEAAAVLRR